MKYYCIGIKGSGMATLAEILYDLGNEVSGYDEYKDYKFTQEGIDKRGIKIYYARIVLSFIMEAKAFQKILIIMEIYFKSIIRNSKISGI